MRVLQNQKPAWALTEEQKEGREEEELEDLLQFASGLDFDKYIEDYEVRPHSRGLARKSALATASHDTDHDLPVGRRAQGLTAAGRVVVGGGGRCATRWRR